MIQEKQYVDYQLEVLRRRANARNVSFYRNSLRRLIYLYQLRVDNKLSVLLARRRSTTVSLETNHFDTREGFPHTWVSLLKYSLISSP